MIRRETDAELANRISNMPGVLSGGPYAHRLPVDWSSAINLCVFLSNGLDAVQIFEQRARHAWEVMTIFAPSCRGRRALETAAEMQAWMLPYVDVAFGSVPDSLPHAQWFYRKLGARAVDYVETDGERFFATPGETYFVFRNDQWAR